jgi:putative SOS response-associated peptidase YedK
MCGRYSLFTPPDDVEARFGAQFAESFAPTYNAAPGQQLPVVTGNDPETIQTFEWGLIPEWADDPSGGNINARAETVTEKPSFRAAYRQRRCLVLADGFYEWREENGTKQPYRVTLADETPFAMAGLWERYTPTETQTGLDQFGAGGRPDPEPEPRETFTIVTTEPNDLVADLHHRMAVILPRDREQEWLTATPDQAADLLEPYPAEEIEAYPVSTAVNDPANDSPAVAQPVGDRSKPG